MEELFFAPTLITLPHSGAWPLPPVTVDKYKHLSHMKIFYNLDLNQITRVHKLQCTLERR